MDFYNADEAPDQDDEDKYAAVRSACEFNAAE